MNLLYITVASVLVNIALMAYIAYGRYSRLRRAEKLYDQIKAEVDSKKATFESASPLTEFEALQLLMFDDEQIRTGKLPVPGKTDERKNGSVKS